MRIFIADDHSVVRRGLKQILQDEYPSAYIEEGSDAEVLIKKVVKESWDLIITDISRDSETWRVGTNSITNFDTENAKPLYIKLISYRFPTCQETEDCRRYS